MSKVTIIGCRFDILSHNMNKNIGIFCQYFFTLELLINILKNFLTNYKVNILDSGDKYGGAI